MSNNENPISKQVEDDEISINFGEIWRALLKYKFLIAITALLFAVLGAIYSLTLNMVYEANVRLVPETSDGGKSSGGGGLGGLSSLANLAGINLGGTSGTDAIQPAMYPNIVQSIPFLQELIPGLAGFNALSAGLVMGIMIMPMVSSLSEDALYAVPKSLREGAYGMGSTRLQTSFRVILPAASSGIIVSVILAFARAVGETLIVAIAAGQQPILTGDPRSSVETITTYIVQVSSGDVQHGSLEYKTIFAAGITLFIFTFILNSVSFYIKKRFQEKYD